ncbi:HAMP domain-containing sensor histidine kinase [Brevibacillus laterosporus]|uniref:HAMP domain-containing sensor histidine kinase n=1 Tax=Brevibacillus laterosporus TaxID=1465 RepID=UPI000839B399|nr:sensor histidine kinase [Brevibacillus laterosporus]
MKQSYSTLKSIQWQAVQQALFWTNSTVLTMFGIFLWIGHFSKDRPEVNEWLAKYLHVSVTVEFSWRIFFFQLVVGLVVATVVGLVSGYIAGNLLKKRLHSLWEATMNLERGMLSYRVPELGSDEIGELGWQLNRLAAKWEGQVASLQRLSTHNAELHDQVKVAAVTEERQRLARELHDAVSQQLFAIAMTTAAIKRLIDKNPSRAAQQIELVEEMAAGAQAEMRALLLHLRPATLQNKSLGEAVEELLEELKIKHTLDINWEISNIANIPNGIEDQLFRILQEALSNSLRHSRAHSITVKLFTLQGHVRLRIADDGIGFDPEGEKMTSYGLVSMRERVDEIGGAMEIYSSPGNGTQIEIRVPLLLDVHPKGVDGENDPGIVSR